jgi:nitroreductase
MTSKTAVTAAPILPVLAERWSPRSYDANYELADQDLLSILEAARWAASGNNIQPWRFSVAKRGTKLFGTIAENLGGFNAAWSPNAAAYVVVSAFNNGNENVHGTTTQFDAGLSTAQLIIQAQSLGIHAHVMGGIEHVALQSALDYPKNLDVLVVVTLGKLASAENLDPTARDRELATRTRLELDEIVLHGNPSK